MLIFRGYLNWVRFPAQQISPGRTDPFVENGEPPSAAPCVLFPLHGPRQRQRFLRSGIRGKMLGAFLGCPGDIRCIINGVDQGAPIPRVPACFLIKGFSPFFWHPPKKKPALLKGYKPSLSLNKAFKLKKIGQT